MESFWSLLQTSGLNQRDGIGLSTAGTESTLIKLAVLYLASDRSSYITGSELYVDGGASQI